MHPTEPPPPSPHTGRSHMHPRTHPPIPPTATPTHLEQGGLELGRVRRLGLAGLQVSAHEPQLHCTRGSRHLAGGKGVGGRGGVGWGSMERSGRETTVNMRSVCMGANYGLIQGLTSCQQPQARILAGCNSRPGSNG
jgi:hypothetical protein